MFSSFRTVVVTYILQVVLGAVRLLSGKGPWVNLDLLNPDPNRFLNSDQERSLVSPSPPIA